MMIVKPPRAPPVPALMTARTEFNSCNPAQLAGLALAPDTHSAGMWDVTNPT